MKFPAFFANKFVRFLVFIACWMILANIYVFLNPPPHKLIKEKYQHENFNVCVIKNNQPKTLALNELPTNPHFCQQPIAHISGINEMFYAHLNKIDEEWELTQYGDSMADPFVYRYRIENNQVVPLWYYYGGGFVLHITAWLFALFATLVSYASISRIFHYRNKKPNLNS